MESSSKMICFSLHMERYKTETDFGGVHMIRLISDSGVIHRRGSPGKGGIYEQ